MKDSHSTTSLTPAHSPAPFTSANPLEGLDDLLPDEPLASGQRKRYLASLAVGVSQG